MFNPFKIFERGPAAESPAVTMERVSKDEAGIEPKTDRARKALRAFTLITAAAFAGLAATEAQAGDSADAKGAQLGSKAEAMLAQAKAEAAGIKNGDEAYAFAEKYVKEFQKSFELPFVNETGQPFKGLAMPQYSPADAAEIATVASEFKDLYKEVYNVHQFGYPANFSDAFNRIGDEWQKAPASVAPVKAAPKVASTPGAAAAKAPATPDAPTSTIEKGVTSSGAWAGVMMEKAEILLKEKVHNKSDAGLLIHDTYNDFVREFYWPTQGENLRDVMPNVHIKKRDYTAEDLASIKKNAVALGEFILKVNDGFDKPYDAATLANMVAELNNIVKKTEYWGSYTYESEQNEMQRVHDFLDKQNGKK